MKGAFLMPTIFITEKPSVAQEYKRILQVSGGTGDGYIEGKSGYLGKDVIITWAVGHLISIAQPNEQDEKWNVKWAEMPMPIIPSNFKYKPIPSSAKQFQIVKKLFRRNDIDAIYYAGDSGREGIYIQALIRNSVFGGKDPKFDERVVWINSFTETEIKRGIKEAKPYHDYDKMIQSGYARAISDWLIGMNFTIALSLACKGKAINTGRVMTPTLAMIVNRQNEIDNFVKTDYYGVSADIGKEINWKAVKESRFFESDELYNENGFLKEQDCDKLIAEFVKDMSLTVSDVKVQKKSELAPLFFNQTDLQSYCSKTFHISPSDTLAIAQELYEEKYTTYPRTSARVISTAVAQDYKKRFGYNIPSKYVDDSQIEDHYAIIPTFEGNADKLTGLKAKVYNAIHKRFMDSMKPAFEYDAVSVTYRHSNGEFFFDSFKNITQTGWKFVEETEKVHYDVPAKGLTVKVSAFNKRNLETTPPTAYTTGSLVAEMEKAGKYLDDKELKSVLKGVKGIGTDATRAGIVKKLIDKEFILVDSKQKVTPTAFGKAIIPIVAKYDEQLVSPAKTAEMETKLSDIANGNISYNSYISEVESYVADTTKRIQSGSGDSLVGVQGATYGSKAAPSNEPLPNCPHCGAELTYGKFGIYCTNKCGVSLTSVFKKELTDKQIRTLLSGKEIVLKDGNRQQVILPELTANEYQGKTFYNWTVKGSQQSENGSTDLPPCPHCGGKLTVGANGIYCTEKCGAGLSKVYGVTLSDEQVKKLLNGEAISYKANGRETTVYPELVANEYQGKTYYNWKNESKGGAFKGKKGFKKR